MEATLEKLEAPVAMLPGSPEDTSMQDASTPPLETPSQTLGFQLAHAGLDSVSGVSNCMAMSFRIPACSSESTSSKLQPNLTYRVGQATAVMSNPRTAERQGIKQLYSWIDSLTWIRFGLVAWQRGQMQALPLQRCR